ncbi:class II aldolase/adducin family protein [Actinomadura sp. B10D3]|uniref:class II aldolase/adducin family protein n=1 Tax=Actinomadura sp. B10D3 TaxID=3153557 RepID=UPI00325DE0F0
MHPPTTGDPAAPPTSPPAPVPPAAAAAELVAAGRVLTHAGLIEGFGHLSVRLDDDTCLITPQKPPVLATADECCVLRLDGTKLDGTGDPPAEAVLHLAAYAARREVRAISRTHPPSILAFSTLGRTLPVLHGLGAFVGDLPLHTDHLLTTTTAQAERVVTDLGAHGVILRGNGLVTLGSTLAEAVVRSFWAAEAARFYLDAAAAALPTAYTPEQVQERDDPAYRRADRTGGWKQPHSPFDRAWDYYRWRYETPSAQGTER